MAAKAYEKFPTGDREENTVVIDQFQLKSSRELTASGETRRLFQDESLAQPMSHETPLTYSVDPFTILAI